MTGMLPYFGALCLFLIGLRLSAFFSGAETGFYRASYLRLSIDAQAGDLVARRILSFCQNPSDFVVTALIGNNIAHYTLTAAVGIATARAGFGPGMMTEIVSTVLIAPIVFTFGELIPKNLYYRAPLQLLRPNARWFALCHRLFLPISFPLMGVTRLLQKVGRASMARPEELLGRARLVQVLSQGHQEGLLTDVQGRLIEGLMQLAAQPATRSVTPIDRILGVPDNMRREEVLDFSARYGLTNVPVRRPGDAEAWYGYVRVIDLALTQHALSSLVRTMPVIEQGATKLEALLTLRTSAAAYGIVKAEEHILGLASHHGLAEQLFRAGQSIGRRRPDDPG